MYINGHIFILGDNDHARHRDERDVCRFKERQFVYILDGGILKMPAKSERCF